MLILTKVRPEQCERKGNVSSPSTLGRRLYKLLGVPHSPVVCVVIGNLLVTCMPW